VGARRFPRAAWLAWAAGTVLAFAGSAAAGESNLQLTAPLVWVLVGISAAGATITWGIMVYALWKFQDPKTRRRRYG
jgi:hypothetical protein